MLLHSKGNYKQGEKTTLRIGENNSKWKNWQRINFQNIQAAHTIQCQKSKQPNQKVGERPKRHFSKEDIQMANQLMKDAQHHSLLKKCKSKSQWDITSHQSEWPSSKIYKQTLERVWRKGTKPLALLGRNVNRYRHSGGQYGDSLQN